jgi:hypothetical protein
MIFGLLVFVLLAGNGFSQHKVQGCYGFDCNEKKWSISLFTGFSALGPGKDIQRQMEHVGFADTRPSYTGWFGFVPAQKYPIVRKGIAWNAGILYAITKRNAVQFAAGRAHGSISEGYDRASGNYSQIRSDLWTAAVNYVWRTGKGNDGVRIGPVLGVYKLRGAIQTGSNVYSNASVFSTSTVKPGIALGYSYSFVQKKSWFLALNVSYTWMAEADTGPFTLHHNSRSNAGEPVLHTSEWKQTHIRLETIHAGLTTGLRF